jgi:hypothetical protein
MKLSTLFWISALAAGILLVLLVVAVPAYLGALATSNIGPALNMAQDLAGIGLP